MAVVWLPHSISAVSQQYLSSILMMSSINYMVTEQCLDGVKKSCAVSTPS
ncbi:predicted protein [Histoplasma capsulatum var. duboisii H88]|uniref:Predicted protein n=1 Tax=Ajellomyces capsulatus (strain H88) TaxID=544711 RepID=F0UM42_AJEC8|nr:predicted protein [Histoplasma capsulatum var. duboisii H88]